MTWGKRRRRWDWVFEKLKTDSWVRGGNYTIPIVSYNDNLKFMEILHTASGYEDKLSEREVHVRGISCPDFSSWTCGGVKAYYCMSAGTIDPKRLPSLGSGFEALAPPWVPAILNISRYPKLAKASTCFWHCPPVFWMWKAKSTRINRFCEGDFGIKNDVLNVHTAYKSLVAISSLDSSQNLTKFRWKVSGPSILLLFLPWYVTDIGHLCFEQPMSSFSGLMGWKERSCPLFSYPPWLW